MRTTIADVTKLMRTAQRDCWASLTYNGIAALISLIRSVNRANIYYAIVGNFEDNHTPNGVVEVYVLDAIEDMTKFVTIALAGFHYWIYFYHVPNVRLWVFGLKGDESKELQEMQEHLLPENAISSDLVDIFGECKRQINKNDSIYRKLSILK